MLNDTPIEHRPKKTEQMVKINTTYCFCISDDAHYIFRVDFLRYTSALRVHSVYGIGEERAREQYATNDIQLTNKDFVSTQTLRRDTLRNVKLPISTFRFNKPIFVTVVVISDTYFRNCVEVVSRVRIFQNVNEFIL